MYVGRFAPTPSGRLHLGSLVALTGAYLRAKHAHGQCLLRIEDLDTPRCKPEYTAQMLRDLKALGFSFDGELKRQHTPAALARYAEILHTLQERGFTYYCTCTRASRRTQPCTCQSRHLTYTPAASLCFSAPSLDTAFDDELLGRQELDLANRSCTLLRSDRVIAYNLACVVDDHDSGVTEVVRGSDLLYETPIQNALYAALGWQAPHYVHLPLALKSPEHKYSKQNHAKAVLEELSPRQALLLSLRFLGQDLSALESAQSCPELLIRAAQSFDITRIPKCSGLISY
ncbi:MAG: tRNA glutamyl-Q(34) synthetase GluQRS [Succinivibrio sp.]|nr:tRNA glutamyl-Q(34) synthetase GluQRS [Succinivibrio sp.]